MTPIKWFGVTVGGIVAISHIGVLGHIMTASRPKHQQPPVLNIPRGDYTSYRIVAGPDGYEIEYRANDPTVLTSERSLEVDSERRGLFGGGSEQRSEHRRDEYTMDGARNIDGGVATSDEGKSAENVECIVADAGARSQGAMAGSAITAGVVVPAVMNIPYIGWLAAGWATLLGNQIGETIGSEVGSVFNDC